VHVQVYDQSAVHTAAREAAEETEGLFKRVTLELMLGGCVNQPSSVVNRPSFGLNPHFVCVDSALTFVHRRGSLSESL
jgi:hypothetical protein